VLVGFSTTFQNHRRVLQNVIDALAPLDARVLVTLGGSIERGELTPAANTVIVPSAPHGIVMREARFAITHGGHGTVIRALANRLPMLVIPHGRDQNDNAVRVTERGAGLALPPSADVAEIRAAARRLLSEAGFRRAARELGDRVAHDAEHSDVVAALEAAAGVMPACAAA
jgi:UDP:flavonoid glycosyltransferase YjiC (YdhE family)